MLRQEKYYRSSRSSDQLMDLLLKLKALESGYTRLPAAIPSTTIEIWHQVILLSKKTLEALEPEKEKDSLKNQDYCFWVKEQIRLLHLRHFAQLEVEEVIADKLNEIIWEIQASIKENLEVILNYLIRYKYAREYLDDDAYDDWYRNLGRARTAIQEELTKSPSIADYPARILDYTYESARYRVLSDTQIHKDTLQLLWETIPESPPWEINQILDEDYPSEDEVYGF